jgi:WD40 repeat protein
MTARCGSGTSRALSVRAHSGGVYAVAASADGKRLVSAGADEKARLWDPKHHRRLAAFDMSAPVAAVAVSADGKRGLAGDDQGAVRLFAVPAMTLVARLRGTEGLVQTAAFSPDGKIMLAGSEDDTVRQYRGKDHAAQTLVGHRAPVTAVIAAGEGRAISAAKDGTLVVWDLASGQAIDRVDLRASEDQPLALAVAPDGNTVAVGTARGVILLYRFAEPP